MRSTLVAALRAETKDEAGDFSTVTVEQLAALRAAGTATVVDANGAETRQKYGTIPGTLLLTHYGDYDAAKELPLDHARKLVFYCAVHLRRCAVTNEQVDTVASNARGSALVDW
jgi:hypothetical protein